MTVELIQNVKFVATRKTRVDKRVVASMVCSKGVNPYGNEVWSDGSLLIPPICSSSNGMCSIIDIQYVVNLKFGASGASLNKHVPIPITIGN